MLNTSATSVSLVQEFIITDQQGNARVSFENNGSGAAVVTQENSYYGFGLVMPNSPVGTTLTSNKQLYNGGSEWQNDYTSLPDYYQTYYRNYDAALARWVGVDPMAESAESLTTYQYAGNNPIMYNDPLGNLLPMPGSHNANTNFVYHGSGGDFGSNNSDSNLTGGFDAGDPNNPSSSYYGNTSAIDGGDYSAFWNGVIEGANDILAYMQKTDIESISLNGKAIADLAIGENAVDNGILLAGDLCHTINVYGVNDKDQTPTLMLKILNQAIDGGIYTKLPAGVNDMYGGFDPYTINLLSIPLDPGQPAYILDVGGDAIVGLGVGKSLQFVAINSGEDAGGLFMYKSNDAYLGWDVSSWAVIGSVANDSKQPFTRNTFQGASYSGSLGSTGFMKAFTVGVDDGGILYHGSLNGFGIGPDMKLPVSFSVGYSHSSLMPTEDNNVHLFSNP